MGDVKNDVDRDAIVNELLQEHPIDEMVKFDQFNLQEKLRKNTDLVAKYTDLLNKEKADLEYLQEMLEKLYGQRYHHYRFNYEENLDKKEIEKYYLPADPQIIQMKRIIRKQQIRVNFFNLCVKSLDRQYWGIRTFLDAEKLT